MGTYEPRVRRVRCEATEEARTTAGGGTLTTKRADVPDVGLTPGLARFVEGSSRGVPTLGPALEAEVFEVGVRLALCHGTPSRGPEQAVRERTHRRRSHLQSHLHDVSEALFVVFPDLCGAFTNAGEGVTVGGKGGLDLELSHLGQRSEESRQGIRARSDPRDVRRDGREDVIARQQKSALGVVPAQMIEGVAGSVDGEPIPPGHPQHVAVVYSMARAGGTKGGERRLHHPECQPLLHRWTEPLPTPREGGSPRVLRGLMLMSRAWPAPPRAESSVGNQPSAGSRSQPPR